MPSMKFAARLFSVIFVALALFLLPFQVSAQTTNPYITPDTNPDVPKNLHTLTQNIVIDVIAALDCQLVGIDPIHPDKPCLGFDTTTKKIGYVQNGGVVGFMGSMIAVLYTPPFHGSDYFQNVAGNFGFAKKTYAASPSCTEDIGYCGLLPLQSIWRVFLNMCYLIFVIIFIVVGLAIMLRVKIDPRTVMSIENSIPKIIIGIVLITLSFAIAGFLIDLMYVAIYVVFNIFSNPNILPGGHGAEFVRKISDTQQTFYKENPFGVFNNLVEYKKIVADSSGGIKDIITNMFSAPSNGFDLFAFLKNTMANLLGSIVSGIALLVIAIAILVSLFRLWIALLMAYVLILIHTVLAPFWIVGEIFPGSPVGFAGWIREMLSNLSSFVVTIAMFLLARVFLTAFDLKENAGVVFVPPLIGNPNEQGGVQTIASLIALGFVLMTPVVVQMMKDLLKAPTFKWTSAIGQQLAAGAQAPGRALSAGSNAAFGLHYDSSGKAVYGFHGLGSTGIGQFARAMGWSH